MKFKDKYHDPNYYHFKVYRNIEHKNFEAQKKIIILGISGSQIIITYTTNFNTVCGYSLDFFRKNYRCASELFSVRKDKYYKHFKKLIEVHDIVPSEKYRYLNGKGLDLEHHSVFLKLLKFKKDNNDKNNERTSDDESGRIRPTTVGRQLTRRSRRERFQLKTRTQRPEEIKRRERRFSSYFQPKEQHKELFGSL